MKARDATVVAISVDPPDTSRQWAEKKGFTFGLASDPEMQVIGAFGLQSDGLALHAIYIVDRDARVFYRKVARRRAYPPELLDALDYHDRRGPWSPSR